MNEDSEPAMKQEEFFNRIKALVEQQRYEDARALLLKAGDHPRAQVWLAELDKLELAKAHGAGAKDERERLVWFVIAVVIVLGGLYLYTGGTVNL